MQRREFNIAARPQEFGEFNNICTGALTTTSPLHRPWSDHHMVVLSLFSSETKARIVRHLVFAGIGFAADLDFLQLLVDQNLLMPVSSAVDLRT